MQAEMQAKSLAKLQPAMGPGGLALALVALLALALPGGAVRAGDDPWPDIRRDVFDNREVVENDGTISLDAPYRAEDAAVVPLTMRIPASIARDVKSLTLVIDKNPAPVAATFHFAEAAGTGERMLSTRAHRHVFNDRAVIETNDGKLHIATKFVKAWRLLGAASRCRRGAGQASARSDQTFRPSGCGRPLAADAEALVMIRHPNFTGMQMDQITREFTPMKIVQRWR
jgi:sulfur-oxidizing protein SoxY